MTPVTDPADEVLDVVDPEDQVVGQAPRREVHDQGLLHRAVHVLLLDGQDRLLLQRRAETKRTYAGLWTSSASGHVPTGQGPATAARRETEEELGLGPADLSPVGRTRFDDPSVGEHEICHVFVGRATDEPDPDPAEVAEVRPVLLGAVDGRLRRAPERFAPSFSPAYDLARQALRELVQRQG